MAGNDKWSVDKLDGAENWATWKFQMKHVMMSRDLWKYAVGTEILAHDADAAAVSAHQRALTAIVLAVSTSQLYLITSCDTAAAAWKALCDHFECKTIGNKLILKKQYFRSEMREGMSMETHLKEMKSLTEKLAAIDSPISEEDQVVTLLGSLPESYQHVVTALEARSDDLTLGYVQQMLLYEEKKKTGPSAPVGEGNSALFSKGRGRYKRNLQCHHCGKNGHFRYECPERKKFGAHNAKAAEEEIASNADADDEMYLFRASTMHPKFACEWLVDSGASCHMTRDRDAITNYQRFQKPEKVSLGDGHALDAVGKGRVTLSMLLRDGESKEEILMDVLHVPDLRCNLFSVRSAVAKGKEIKFGGNECTIHDKEGDLRAIGILDGKLYKLKCKIGEYASVSTLSTNLDLWHNRLGHMSEQRMKFMMEKKMVQGMMFQKTDTVKLCDGCIGGKTAKKKFKSVEEKRSSRKLELIHSDVCGPMQTGSHGGKKYFVSFTDDFTKCCTIYFMTHKSEVLDKFKEFEAAVTTETGLKIGGLRTDNGGEYVSEQFRNFLKLKGIQHELTIPYTPQQNGTAERLNRILVESARAMLIHSGLPNTFWAEAISTAAYIRNRTVTSSLAEKTPYEMWYERKPDLQNMKVFGCVAHVLVDESQRRKLDSKTTRMLFVGYSKSPKGYRVYDPEKNKAYIRRDAVFDESAFHQNKCQEQASDLNTGSVETVEAEDDMTEEENAPPGRPQRERRAPMRYGYEEFGETVHYVYNVATLKEALESADADEWKAAADDEYNSLKENNTWNLVEAPPNTKIIKSRWVFKVKHESDGSIDRFKARLVAKGYSQVQGVDYNETFSPVVRFTTVRALLALGVQEKKLIHQMDVTTAFLNGKLEEDVYMYQPEGYSEPGKEDLVCKLNKSIYGLKQSPRCWNAELHKFLTNIGFSQCNADTCVYIKEKTIIAIYVDDLIIMTDTESEMTHIKKEMSGKFKMKDMGPINFFLGVSVQRKEDSVVLHQRAYIQEILGKYQMSDAKPVATPSDPNVQLTKDDGSNGVDQTLYQSIVGALLYVSMATRPDIAQAVGAVSRFNADPKQTHLTAAKRILCYLKATMELALVYGCEEPEGCCYSDADWGGDRDTRHSTSGYIFTLCGGAISWNSKLQRVTALSTAEAEYIALSEACKEVMWIKKLVDELLEKNVSQPIKVMEDNQAAIAMVKNPVYHSRSKHIDIRFHFIRDLYQEGHIMLQYCPSSENVADLMTKPIPRIHYERLRLKLGLTCI